MATKKTGAAEYLRKITAKDIMGEAIKNLLPDDGSQIQLFVVYGLASGTKTKDTAFGPATAVTGSFEAVRNDGAIFQAAVAYLPEPAGSTLIEAVKARIAQESSVEFAVAVGIKPSKKSAVGYEYWCKPYQKPEERDALAHLRGSVQSLLLEAPK